MLYGQRVRHRAERAGGCELHAATDLDVPSRPGRDRAAIATNNRIVGQELIELMRDDLGFHRKVRPTRALFHEMIPLLYPSLNAVEKSALRLALDERQQRAEDVGASSDQTDLDRVSKADPIRIDIDLHTARLARRGVELVIGKAAADNHEGVALVDGVR
jgi:hypothetical protein